MKYLFWTIVFIVGSIAIYWIIDYMNQMDDDK